MSEDLLQRYRDAELDLAELVDVATHLLAGHVPGDARVAPHPDARTVRYYQSLGIVDRPRLDGRRAIYAFRQLAQVVATKLLQGRGYSLAKVQQALAGRTTDQIASAASQALATLPPRPTPPPHLPAAPPPASSGPRALHSVELAPGIAVTIDPTRVSDPEALVRRLAAALATGGTP
ncbi:MAG: MerR family transcriptional regulator [Deltaproteobacteria bacterium]|nr:MAG: MerR family transcriptional regulator [Deltaproteobacteria bacterium]